MKLHALFAPFCCAFAISAGASAAQNAPAQLNATASYLAGLEVATKGSLATLTKEEGWKAHAKAMGKAWSETEKTRLSKIRAWRDKELKDLTMEKTWLFYPFSGPDLIHLQTFYPEGETCVMIGLEGVGKIPEVIRLSAEERVTELKRLRVSLEDSLFLSFFRTDDLKVELKARPLDGVLPVLYTYAALMGDELQSVELIDLNKDGTIKAPAKGKPLGAKITYKAPGSPKLRTMYYFCQNLADDAMKRDGTPLSAFLERLGTCHTYLKAASYLMHKPYFSVIRNHILTHSLSVLQDDSGIAHRYFEPTRWNARYFGFYNKPVAKFDNRFQKDLKVEFDKPSNSKPIDFGVGYRHKGMGKESNLVLYTQKK